MNAVDGNTQIMNIPFWALSIAFWAHMLATVLWIGGLVVLSVLVLPAARKTLDPQAYARFLEETQRRLDPLGWFSIILLLTSGMFQMSANPHYEGFLSISSLWSGAILVKHLFFGIMVAVSGIVTWGIMPALRREALLHARGKAAPNLARSQKWLTHFMLINLVLGILVLLLTAIARSA